MGLYPYRYYINHPRRSSEFPKKSYRKRKLFRPRMSCGKLGEIRRVNAGNRACPVASGNSELDPKLVGAGREDQEG
jgi:hypothetical protein